MWAPCCPMNIAGIVTLKKPMPNAQQDTLSYLMKSSVLLASGLIVSPRICGLSQISGPKLKTVSLQELHAHFGASYKAIFYSYKRLNVWLWRWFTMKIMLIMIIKMVLMISNTYVFLVVAQWRQTMPEILTNISGIRYHYLTQSWTIINGIPRNSFREMWFKM